MPFCDTPMNDRERFEAVMHYRPFDRGVIQDFQCWDETPDVWHEYGLPAEVAYANWHEFFGFDRFWDSFGCQTLLHPELETTVLADEGDTEVIRTNEGATIRRHKYASSIPVHLDHLLKDRDSWERHFKWRLDPARPDRLWPDMQERFRQHCHRDYPLSIGAGSMFGMLRNWMGLEGVSYIQYDDPALFAEMIQTIGHCIVGTLERVLSEADRAGVTYDLANMWEDMTFAQGPLLSVEKFKEHLVPHYRRITALLREHGVDLVMLDSDGDVSLLLPHWLEAGVNVIFPLEVGTWGTDPLKVRRQYGQALRICGGFDKHILARGQNEITREIERLAPLVEEGGFIPFCDHRVPPDVSPENYVHYVRKAKEVWGRGLASLRPTGELSRLAPRFGQPYDFQAVFASRATPFSEHSSD